VESRYLFFRKNNRKAISNNTDPKALSIVLKFKMKDVNQSLETHLISTYVEEKYPRNLMDIKLSEYFNQNRVQKL